MAAPDAKVAPFVGYVKETSRSELYTFKPASLLQAATRRKTFLTMTLRGGGHYETPQAPGQPGGSDSRRDLAGVKLPSYPKAGQQEKL